MSILTRFPTIPEAELLLQEGYEKNPGPWVQHCKITARVASAIAKRCGLDDEKAYVSGLLHDIGYSEFRNYKGRTCHIIIGYGYMLQKGYGAIARICLTHSFPYKNIGAYGGSDTNWSESERLNIIGFLSNIDFDDYDKLIQLSDALSTAESVCFMDKRMMDVVRRHGFSEFTVPKWEATFALKDYFDNLAGANIYKLFAGEIIEDILG
ncbi:MAG: HDIG domain-containing protein [Defluviitaleaceae bacterium]|nr:HDIG domain-containing protein [Defluviitaleaceae bacterium]